MAQAEGFALGYHLFDAETGTVIVDGPRIYPGDLKSGEAAKVQLELRDAGGRRALPVLDLAAARGCVLVLRARLAIPSGGGGGGRRAGVARPHALVTTRAALGRVQALRSIGRAFVYPVLTVWRNRGLIRVMVRREVLGRYRGSFGGSFWTVMNPLFLMLTYFFVFSLVLRSAFPGDPSRAGYVLYFVAGMLPWLAFSEAVGRAPTVVIDHRNFVKKLVFAVETLPFNLVTGGLVSEFFAVLVFCAMLLALRHSVPVTILWLPLLVIPQVMFTAGLAWFLAALGAFVRDLGQTHRIRIDDLVLHVAHLLSRRVVEQTAAVGRHAAFQEPHLRSGARLPRHSTGAPRTGVRLSLEVLDSGGCGVCIGPRVVLQIEKIVRRHDLIKVCFTILQMLW